MTRRGRRQADYEDEDEHEPKRIKPRRKRRIAPQYDVGDPENEMTEYDSGEPTDEELKAIEEGEDAAA